MSSKTTGNCGNQGRIVSELTDNRPECTYRNVVRRGFFRMAGRRAGTQDDFHFMAREKTNDISVWGEGFNFYQQLAVRQGDVVLDIGAHIGGFVTYASTMGAKKITACEPEPENYRLLQRNMELLTRLNPKETKDGHRFGDIDILRMAVVGDDRLDTAFYRSVSGSQSIHSIVVKKDRQEITVPAISADRIFKETQPTIVKFDIEGGEYDAFLQAEIPQSVRAIGGELHLYRRQWRRQDAPAFIEKLKVLGFAAIVPPIIRDSNWHTNGIWRR